MTLSQVFWLSVVCVSCIVGGCALRPLVQDSRTEARQSRLTELEQIKLDGTEAAKKGIPVQACPYPSVQYNYTQAQAWKQGWIKGFTHK